MRVYLLLELFVEDLRVGKLSFEAQRRGSFGLAVSALVKVTLHVGPEPSVALMMSELDMCAGHPGAGGFSMRGR